MTLFDLVAASRTNPAVAVDRLTGYVWVYGGAGNDATEQNGIMSDLWRFDPATGMYSWMSGSTLRNMGPVAGGLGVFVRELSALLVTRVHASLCRAPLSTQVAAAPCQWSKTPPTDCG